MIHNLGRTSPCGIMQRSKRSENRLSKTRTSQYAWMAFAAICVMAVVWTGIQFNCMNLYAAPVVEDLGISRTQFMVVLSIPGAISAIISLFFFGPLEQRFGIRRMMLVGGTINTLSFLAWTFMDSLWMLYLGGVLYGFCCSVTAYTCVSAAVNIWFKKRIGTLVGIANSLGSAAGIVFAIVIAQFIATVGWRCSFAVCAGISVASVVACVALFRGNPEDLGVEPMYADAQAGGLPEEVAEPMPAEAAEPMRAAPSAADLPFSQALRKPKLWLLAIGYLLLGTITYGIMSTLPLFALDFGYGNLQGQVVSASLFAAAIAMVPMGIFCDKAGTKWGIALTGVIVVAAAIVLSRPALPFAAVVAAAVCSGAAYGACGVTVGVGVKEALGEVDYSKKLGLCSGFMYVGLALAPTATNLAYDFTGSYSVILGAYAVLAVVMAAIFFIGMGRRLG